MLVRLLDLVPFVALLGLISARQLCYWPDGTPTLNDPLGRDYQSCRGGQDSHCCLRGETCLTNGLCFGAGVGWVCLMRTTLRIQKL